MTDNVDLSHQQPVPVVVRGDASVMYKFLNPNLMTVVTENNAAANRSDDKPYEPALNLYIINAVNGQIVHQTRIKDGSSPVKFLQ